MPPLLHLHEACLYADDLPAMERFYVGVLGLRKVSDNSPRGITLRVGDVAVLLIFNPALSQQPHPLVPAHGATGPGHCAFSIPPDTLDTWRAHLVTSGVAVERETTWDTGAVSIYFRDPCGNSIELVAGELWPR